MAYLDFFFSFSFHFFLLSSSKNPPFKIGWRPKIASPSSIRSKLLLHLIRMFDVAYPNSKLQKQGGQRRTRDTGQIRHRHAHCFLERKLRQMVLLREPTLHLQLHEKRKIVDGETFNHSIHQRARLPSGSRIDHNQQVLQARPQQRSLAGTSRGREA